MKPEIKNPIHKLLFILLYSIILLAVGLLIGVIITKTSDQKLYDILTYEGLLLAVIGIIMSMKGSPSGTNGDDNAQDISNPHSEATRIQRMMNRYRKNFYQKRINHFTFYSLVLIVSGLLMLAASLLMIYL